MSVYFVASGPYIKIGYSKDPIHRSTTVTTSGIRPADLPRFTETRLIGWIPGDTRREMAVLVQFADHWVRGEWFDGGILPQARELIWSDSAGVDLERMSAMAVFAADRHPGITREEMATAGIPVEAAPMAKSSFFMSEWLKGGAA